MNNTIAVISTGKIRFKSFVKCSNTVIFSSNYSEAFDSELLEHIEEMIHMYSDDYTTITINMLS